MLHTYLERQLQTLPAEMAGTYSLSGASEFQSHPVFQAGR
jgi:hypothetical protein